MKEENAMMLVQFVAKALIGASALAFLSTVGVLLQLKMSVW